MYNMNKLLCKSLEVIENIFFNDWRELFLKHLAKIVLCVFGGVPLTPLNTLKLYTAKCFFFRLMMKVFCII